MNDSEPQPLSDSAQTVPSVLAGKPGAPAGNANRLLGGEKSKRRLLPLHRASEGDGDLLYEVNKWRQAIEAELVGKDGHISPHQDALITTACQWELCRRRRNRLAGLNETNEADRIKHEEIAGANSERRDRALAAAGLGKSTAGNGGGGGGDGNGADLLGGLKQAIAEADSRESQQ
jgi:hypothetical protein